MDYLLTNNQQALPSSSPPSFSSLFKRYRLRAEFGTYAQFSEALAERGFFYDVSIFCHWQKGTRKPVNRQLLLSMIAVFVERKSIVSVQQANEFLASTGLGYLTESEIAKYLGI